MKKIMSKKLKMAITLSVCAILLVFGTIMGTVAYLTSQTTVTNTFTYGNVSITMTELTAAENDGDARIQLVDGNATNEYKLIPGHTYEKDLTIHVGADSEDCYLFVKVAKEFVNADSKIATTLVSGWTVLDAEKGIYYYDTTVHGGANVEVIDSFTVDEEATATDLQAFSAEYKVIAYAVQAAGFPDVTTAWRDTFGK